MRGMVNKLKLNRVGSQQAEITEITGERQVGGPWRKAMPLNADLQITELGKDLAQVSDDGLAPGIGGYPPGLEIAPGIGAGLVPRRGVGDHVLWKSVGDHIL